MLTIQPNITNYRVSRPAFGMSQDEVEREKEFYQESVEQLDEFINNDVVPDKIKKPFKFFRVLGNAAFTGLAVFGSFLGITSAAKKGKAHVQEYKFVQKASAKVKKIFNSKYTQKFFTENRIGKKIAEYAKKVKEFFANIFAPLKGKINEEKITKGTATVLGTGSGAAAGYEEMMKQNPIKFEQEDENIIDDEVDE